ncbi:MAG TPA: hypothetical protein VH593_28290, partial [Ktedonobacteraceae bacterium]
MPHIVVVESEFTGGGGDTTGVCVPPHIHAFAQRIYNAMEPIANIDKLYCWHWMRYVGGLGEMYQEADDIARNGPPWSSVVDIDRCPDWALLWLAQFVGTRVPARYDADDARNYIKATPNWKRGTPAAIIGATQLHLTGKKDVYISERLAHTPDP